MAAPAPPGQAAQSVARSPLSGEAVRAVEMFDWPGNVRQLQNIIERSTVLSKGEQIDAEFIPLNPTAAESDDAGAEQDYADDDGLLTSWQSLEENEREHLERTLELTGYNQSAAARLLEIDYRLLLRRIKKYGLKRNGTATASRAHAKPRRPK